MKHLSVSMNVDPLALLEAEYQRTLAASRPRPQAADASDAAVALAAPDDVAALPDDEGEDGANSEGDDGSERMQLRWATHHRSRYG